jgi:hypothetical protein
MFGGDAELERDGHGLTEYELQRVARIRRNRAVMQSLGLADHDIVSAARQRYRSDCRHLLKVAMTYESWKPEPFYYVLRTLNPKLYTLSPHQYPELSTSKL